MNPCQKKLQNMSHTSIKQWHRVNIVVPKGRKETQQGEITLKKDSSPKRKVPGIAAGHEVTSGH